MSVCTRTRLLMNYLPCKRTRKFLYRARARNFLRAGFHFQRWSLRTSAVWKRSFYVGQSVRSSSRRCCALCHHSRAERHAQMEPFLGTRLLRLPCIVLESFQFYVESKNSRFFHFSQIISFFMDFTSDIISSILIIFVQFE